MSYFVDYHHLITTRPNDVRQVLISDLHLSHDEPALAQAFLSLLDDLIALPNLQAFYILGDWFDAWIGDDAYLSLSDREKQTHWITPFIRQLKQLRMNGCAIYIMHGNRDFLIGQLFCNSFGGTLIQEPYPITIGDQRFRLEHGDALCTDDKTYQRFRKLMRNRFVQGYLLNKSLVKRQKIAEKMRQKSQKSNASKATYIMDVNATAVNHAVTSHDALLHGHTHRPEVHVIHEVNDTFGSKNATPNSQSHLTAKTRYVLGDWRIHDKGGSHQQVEAVIGMVVSDSSCLETHNDDRLQNQTNASDMDNSAHASAAFNASQKQSIKKLSPARETEFIMVRFTH